MDADHDVALDDRLASLRREYAAAGLDEDAAGDDPIALVDSWLADAIASGMHEPNAMAVATATPDGYPSLRIVLLKGFDVRGPVFFTNYDSRKGQELAANPRAALALLWHPLQRQVRIEGPVRTVPPEESDAYFSSRPHGSRLGALASPQSHVVASRTELDQRYDTAAAAYPAEVPRPEHWGGYRVEPEVIELWQGRVSRMHDRLRFTRTVDGWRRDRLAP